MEGLTSVLGNSAGFFSGFFFLLNHYIYSKRRNIKFHINSDEWLYRHKDGWDDYFEPILGDDNLECKQIFGHNNHIELHSIKEYETAIKEVYKFNEKTRSRISEVKSTLGLEKKESSNENGKNSEPVYDAIYIRRGDKLAAETVLRHASEYIKILLKKNPECKILFLQTDDYQCFLELEEYISEHNLNIKLLTTCSKNARGSITSEKYRMDIADALGSKSINYDYLVKIAGELTGATTISAMDSDAIYEHTIDLLASLDITTHSNVCVTDYESNVGRFIKLAHIAPENVINVLSPDEDIDYNIMECPAYHF